MSSEQNKRMGIDEHVRLSDLTTFHIGGLARGLARCADEADIKTALLHSQERGLPWYVIGQGSNLLAIDEPIERVLIQMASEDLSFEEDDASVLVIADAGVSWDALVRACAERELWGIENLAGIPGTAGAAPVQNIGAYGAELSDTLAWVDAYDTLAQQTVRIPASECGLAYRESRFKQDSRFIITRIALALSRTPSPRIAYADLAKAKEAGVSLDTPVQIGEAVRAIRSKKFPDIAECGTAGSFFKNPIITPEAYDALHIRYPDLAGFASDAGVKIPLAWILDHALGLNGYRLGPVRLFETQPLVVVADFGATKRDVDALATDVAQRVHDLTGITIEREVRTLS